MHTTHPRALRIVLPAAIAALLASAVAAAPADAAGPRVDVPSSQPASTSRDLGAVRAKDAVEVQIALDLPDERGATDLATAVSTPGAASYGHPLTPRQWIDRFSPTQAQVDELTRGLKDAGFTVGTVPASRLFVLARADAAAVDAYFRTRVHTFATASGRRLAAAAPVSLPARAGRHVAGVLFDHARITDRRSRRAASAGAVACSAHWRQHVVRIPEAYGATTASTPLCGYGAKQVRALAGLGSAGAGDGRGQTVAVVAAFGSPTIRADLATYSRRNGLPAADYAETVPARSAWRTGPDCTAAGWAGEQTLDLEAVHAVAPRARLRYVGARDCAFGFDVAMSTILDEGLATIVSNSWGSTALDTAAALGRADDQALSEIVVDVHQHLQAAGTGVGLYFASGDAGDDEALAGRRAVDFPSSSPWVTSVGGTAVALDRSGRRVFTVPWGENVAVAKGKRWHTGLPGLFVGGAGGGASRLFEAPASQALVRGTSIAHGMRATTDVSALAASSTGMLVGRRVHGRYRTEVVGGTSLATPIVAAQAAVAQQSAGRALGFLNPALARVAARGAVRDVTASTHRRAVAFRTKGVPTLVTLDRDSSLAARRGYDYPTGVGELTAASLRALAAFRPA